MATLLKHRREVAEQVAQRHKTIDPFVLQVFQLTSKDGERGAEPIKLLEVVDGTPEIGIQPVYFLPDSKRGVPYPLVIVEISPAEFRQRGRRSIRINGDTWKFG